MNERQGESLSNPLLVIVTGLPSTGKTTIGRQLAEQFSLPFISKDTIKEQIFDTLGWQDRTWSKKVGITAYAILDYMVEEELRASRAVILDSNFKPQFDNEKFQAWQAKYGYKCLQILCETEGTVLFERFRRRTETNDRHPGHDDKRALEEWREPLTTGTVSPLDIDSELIRIDTTDFEKVDLGMVSSALAKFLDS